MLMCIILSFSEKRLHKVRFREILFKFFLVWHLDSFILWHIGGFPSSLILSPEEPLYYILMFLSNFIEAQEFFL